MHCGTMTAQASLKSSLKSSLKLKYDFPSGYTLQIHLYTNMQAVQWQVVHSVIQDKEGFVSLSE